MNERKKSVLVIDLPSSNPIKKNQTRIIKLVYTDMQEPQVPYKSLLSIPRFTFELLPPDEKGFRTQVVVLPPQDFELKLNSMSVKQKNSDGTKTDITESEDVHKTVSKAVLDFSLPTREVDAEFQGEYEIHPDSEEKLLFELYFWGITIFSLMILLVLGVASFYSSYESLVSNSFLASVLPNLD